MRSIACWFLSSSRSSLLLNSIIRTTTTTTTTTTIEKPPHVIRKIQPSAALVKKYPPTEFKPIPLTTSTTSPLLLPKQTTRKDWQLDVPLSGPYTAPLEPISPRRDIYAVVGIGAHQYKVTNGDLIIMEKINVDIGKVLDLCKVLLIGTKHGRMYFGHPVLETASVRVTVEAQMKTEKELIYKKRRRKHYTLKRGERHPITLLRVNNITYRDEKGNLI